MAPLPILLCLLVAAAPAEAAKRDPWLWATVNVCDSATSPNAMGVRASMPGNRSRERMYMRFSAQWYSKARKRWLRVEGASSRWVRVGSAMPRYRQAGYTFEFDPPARGVFLVRGVVDYQWRKRRRGGRVLQRARRTTSRSPGTADEGEGIARASCYIA